MLWTCGIAPRVCPTSEAAAKLGGTVLTAMERGLPIVGADADVPPFFRGPGFCARW